MNYSTAIQQARKLWTSGAGSQRLIAALVSQFPDVTPTQIEDDFFESMGEYPEPLDSEGGGDGIYY